MIFTVRTTVSQEDLVVDMLKRKMEKEELEVYSIIMLPGLRGYVLVEADNEMTVQRLIYDTPGIKGRGIVGKGEINIKELDALLESKPLMESIKVKQEVQIISGPFKGERAKVMRVNESKEEVTVELMEAAVKIPVTIKAENIKILK